MDTRFEVIHRGGCSPSPRAMWSYVGALAGNRRSGATGRLLGVRPDPCRRVVRVVPHAAGRCGRGAAGVAGSGAVGAATGVRGRGVRGRVACRVAGTQGARRAAAGTAAGRRTGRCGGRCAGWCWGGRVGRRDGGRAGGEGRGGEGEGDPHHPTPENHQPQATPTSSSPPPSPPRPLLLVPVPSARHATAARGHDPARRIALRAARQLRCQGIAARMFPGVAATTSRGGPGRTVRGRPAGEPHRCAGPASGSERLFSGWLVIVVDDLMTTGASLTEATRAVRSAGGQVLGAGVIAASPRSYGPPAAPTGLMTHRR